jgi:hypothetical protein
MRQTGMRRCGKAWDSELVALMSKRGQRAGAEVFQCLNRACGKWHVRNVVSPVPAPVRKPRRETGFPAPVKLAVRVRAGQGDAEQACCESCGRWLGRYGGEVQHRLARKAGGTRSRVINGKANGALLCGNRYEGCHKLAEDRDEDMRRRGWWIRDGRGPDHDPRLVPVEFVSAHGLKRTVWLAEDGSYSEVPRGARAA